MRFLAEVGYSEFHTQYVSELSRTVSVIIDESAVQKVSRGQAMSFRERRDDELLGSSASLGHVRPASIGPALNVRHTNKLIGQIQ